MLAVHRKTGAAIVREGDPSGSVDFVLKDRDGRLAVKDLDSHLGTIVNGTRIAKFEERSIAGLTRGPNEIQAGGVESPYRFRVIVERN